MSDDVLMEQAQAMRNMGIAIVQQAEAQIRLLHARVPPPGPTCGDCGGSRLQPATKGVVVCLDCQHNQPG